MSGKYQNGAACEFGESSIGADLYFRSLFIIVEDVPMNYMYFTSILGLMEQFQGLMHVLASATLPLTPRRAHQRRSLALDVADRGVGRRHA